MTTLNQLRARVPAADAARSAALALAVAAGVCLSGSAQAALGESAGSVARDRAALHATALTLTPSAAYGVYSITTAEGTIVREYVTPRGIVFATTWIGPSQPDLRVLLGGHYPKYAAAVSGRASTSKIFSMAADGLVLQVVKLPRGLRGTAYVAGLVPPGAAAERL